MGKTATKRDDYTRLQNLNALFSVIGSVSTQEETVQLQRTLSFMRENDDLQGHMSTRSFEHCIEQVVRFHFPNDRNFHYTHWNARCHTIEPLWVHASVLEFIDSFKGSMRGMIWYQVSGKLFQPVVAGLPAKKKNIRNYALTMQIWWCEMPATIRTCRSSFSDFLLSFWIISDD